MRCNPVLRVLCMWNFCSAGFPAVLAWNPGICTHVSHQMEKCPDCGAMGNADWGIQRKTLNLFRLADEAQPETRRIGE